MCTVLYKKINRLKKEKSTFKYQYKYLTYWVVEKKWTHLLKTIY